MPTVFDPSFKGVGQKPGLDIWRVEKLKVIKKANTDVCYEGQLYEGDTYIVLQTKVLACMHASLTLSVPAPLTSQCDKLPYSVSLLSRSVQYSSIDTYPVSVARKRFGTAYLFLVGQGQQPG